MSKIDSITFIDVETTGLDSELDSILEVCWAKVAIPSLEVVHSGGGLVSPNKNPHPFLYTAWKPERFNGANWAFAEPLHRRLLDLRACMLDSAIGGQNPMFDIGFLRTGYHHIGCEMPKHPEIDYHVIDVSSMAIPLLLRGEVEGVSLRSTRLWAGLTGEQSHRAREDVDDTIEVFRKIITRGIPGLGVPCAS